MKDPFPVGAPHVRSSRYGKRRNKKRATCFATFLQNELNSDVALYTTRIKPVLQQIRLLTGLNLGGKTRNIAFQLVLQQCCKTSCTILLPVFPYFNKFNGGSCNSCYVGETRRHFHTPEFLASDKPSHVFKH